jgi:hypothetical protein
VLEILRMEPGYLPYFLEEPKRLSIPEHEAQKAFLKRWPEKTFSGG